MHELSVALEICRVLEGQLTETQLPQLVTIGLDVGEAYELELANLTFCLDTLLAQPPFAGAAVAVSRVPGADLRVGYLEIDDERERG